MKKYFTLLLAALLSACAQSPQQSALDVEQIPQYYQNDIASEWQLSGRIVVQKADDAWQANFYWNKNLTTSEILFTDPLGKTLLRLRQNIQQGKPLIKLESSRDSYTGEGDIEAFLEQYTGYKIPVTSLQYWVFSQIAPTTAVYKASVSRQHTPVTLLSYLHQGQWQIHFSKPAQLLPKIWVNRIIRAKHEDYQIKIIIKNIHMKKPVTT